MMLIAEKFSNDGRRHALVYNDDGHLFVVLKENEQEVHKVEIAGVVRQAEILAEDFCSGSNNPSLILG